MSKQFLYYFRIGLILFFCIGTLMGCVQPQTSPQHQAFQPVDWQPLVEVTPNLGRELLSAYTELPPTAIAEMKIAIGGSWQVIDFNFRQLCGSMGCLYALVYDGEIVKVDYYNPYLAEGQSLWATDGTNLQLCLQSGNQIAKKTFSYDPFRGLIVTRK